MKYPKYQINYTSLESISTYEGESIEDKVLRITKNNEPIEDTAPLYRDWETDRKSTRLNSSHSAKSRMPSSA